MAVLVRHARLWTVASAAWWWPSTAQDAATWAGPAHRPSPAAHEAQEEAVEGWMEIRGTRIHQVRATGRSGVVETETETETDRQREMVETHREWDGGDTER